MKLESFAVLPYSALVHVVEETLILMPYIAAWTCVSDGI